MPESSTKQFSGIFVSYRRDDSSGHAGRLFDKLVNHFGKDRIFMDIDTIEPGEDFVTVVENAVASCDILIAMIGRHWLTSADGSVRQLDNENDFVRLEIGAALSREIRVIPVLIQRASMPKPQDLPDDLAKLARRNAIELTDLRWQTDVDQLITVMERVLGKRAEEVRLAEAGRQAEEMCHRVAEEKRRTEKDKQLRLAENEARQRSADKSRREVADHQGAPRQSLQVSREKQIEHYLPALDTPSSSVKGAQLPDYRAIRNMNFATFLPDDSGHRKMLLVIVAWILFFAIVGLVSIVIKADIISA